MAAGRYSFTIEQGATVDFEIQYLDANETPISLVGYNGRMQIKSDYADNAPEIYCTLSSSLNPDGTGLHFNGSGDSKPLTSGSIGIYISAATSSLFKFDTAKYDLELYRPTNNDVVVVRLLEGQVKINKEVTT